VEDCCRFLLPIYSEFGGVLSNSYYKTYLLDQLFEVYQIQHNSRWAKAKAVEATLTRRVLLLWSARYSFHPWPWHTLTGADVPSSSTSSSASCSTSQESFTHSGSSWRKMTTPHKSTAFKSGVNLVRLLSKKWKWQINNFINVWWWFDCKILNQSNVCKSTLIINVYHVICTMKLFLCNPTSFTIHLVLSYLPVLNSHLSVQTILWGC